MDTVNKTLYIPLYGKAYVSERGLILTDRKAGEIWAAEGFPLKGKAKSKWLAYYMGMRAAVFDDWLKEQLRDPADTVVLHIGCGMDNRIGRVGTTACPWYDIDFPEVIEERRRYYRDDDLYRMTEADVRQPEWLAALPAVGRAVVVMEGVSMYLRADELQALFRTLQQHFGRVQLLMDSYTSFAAKASKRRNPVREVGVTEVYGFDDPTLPAAQTDMVFVKEHDMTPARLIRELEGFERFVFKAVYAGRISKKLYRLYEYQSV